MDYEAADDAFVLTALIVSANVRDGCQGRRHQICPMPRWSQGSSRPGEVIRIIGGRGSTGSTGIETLDPCADMGSLLDRNSSGRTLEVEKIERRVGDDLVDLAGIE